MNGGPLLALTDVVKRFGGLIAVDTVSLEVPSGQILALIGPNGAGKTTLFNAISGIHRPDAGRVVLDGTDIAGRPAYAIAHRGVAKAHQVPKPLPQLTVLQNAVAGAAFGRRRASLAEAAPLAGDALEFVGLAAKRDLLAAQLNVGEKKKLELARCLAADPVLLLLDELAAGLNPTEVNQLLELLRGVRERGMTIVMVEHLMQMVMQVSDRVVVLDSGRLIADGAPEEVAADEQVIRAYLGAPAEEADG